MAWLSSLFKPEGSMSTNVVWGDGITYSIPAAGEINWSTLSAFLIALGNGAGITVKMKQAVRKALTTPVTVNATTDCIVVTQLTSPGAVTVNLPAGSAGQIFAIVDGTGDAATNNVTINRNGSDTIAGATTTVLNHNRQVVWLAYSSTDTDWKIINKNLPPGSVSLTTDVTGILPTANGGTNQNSTATFPTSGVVVTEAATETLTNKTLTGNTAVNLISGSGTLVLNTTGTITAPNATDTLVGKATTDTLTNKTLTGNTAVNLVSGSGTLTLNTTGTITTPNATDTLVGKATTDTLTNKSISGSTNTITNVSLTSGVTGVLPLANGGTNTNAASANAAFNALSPLTTKGDLVTYSTVNARLPVGTDGQVLSAASGQTTGLQWVGAASTSLTQFFTDIGDSSNNRTATNTSLLGNIKALTTSQSYTVTNAAPGVFTVTGHGFLTGDPAYVTATQNGFTLNTRYYVSKVDANTFKLSTTLANAVAGTGITSSGTTAGTINSGGLNFISTGIPGVIDGSSATAGYVGQVITSTFDVTTFVTGQYVDLSSIVLTPGDWLISYNLTVNATAALTACSMAISTTSGNSSSGITFGDNGAGLGLRNSTSGDLSSSISNYHVSISASTTYYAKGTATFASGSPEGEGRINAVRIR